MIDIFGASIRGQAHKRSGKPNQDAWLVRKTEKSCLVVVCDGVGSAAEGRLGAKAACHALAKTAQCVYERGSIRKEDFWTSLEKTWRQLISPCAPENAATTVQFAFLLRESLICGGIGDGVLYFRQGRMPGMVIHSRDEDCFSNETWALGWDGWLHNTFWWESRMDLEGSWKLFLATDGIADDLIPERRDEFLDWAIDEFGDGAL